jgi:hypothetical protein
VNEIVDVDQQVLALEAPLRALKGLGRENVEDILSAALDDVFEEDEAE